MPEMPLSRPALELLGISPSFVRTHPTGVVVAVADAVYRAAMRQYHTEAAAVKIPAGVNLTELQAARDAIRNDPTACMKEISRGERTSREGKLAEELAAQVSTLQEMDDAWAFNAAALLDFIAREKLGLTIKEVAMDERPISYSTLHLNGVAILVTQTEHGTTSFCEYLRHGGTWFMRPVARGSFTRNHPCPPGIPKELILVSSAGIDRGNFYDQSGPHVMLDGFDVLGSYMKADLVAARAAKRKAEGHKAAAQAPALGGETVDKATTWRLDPLVVRVLKPIVTIGSILLGIKRTVNESVEYAELGLIAGIRLFDDKQRS